MIVSVVRRNTRNFFALFTTQEPLIRPRPIYVRIESKDSAINCDVRRKAKGGMDIM